MVGEGFLSTLPKSLKEGKVTLPQIDMACRRILEAKYKLGLFDDPYRYCDEDRAKREVLSPEKRQAAKEFAEHSFVLLKNNSNTLPLKKSGTIALIGPLANNKSNMLGTWAVSGDAQLSIPVLEGFKNLLGNSATILYAKGANITDDTVLAKKANVFGERVDYDKKSPQQLIDEAVTAANNADVVVAVVGEASEMTGESSSRSDIGLPESQRNLLKALSKTGKPIVLVIMSGRPLTIEWESSIATSILQVWFAGHEAGNAIADVLFGGYNPSGKTTISFPRNVGQIPIYYNHKNTGRPLTTENWEKFHSDYLDVANSPLYPFGYGLSYTTFSYGDVTVSSNSPKGNQTITVTAKVTNTGRFAGEEVVQLYIKAPPSLVTRSVKDLKGFTKILLLPGESKDVSFKLTTEDLKYFNTDLKQVWAAGKYVFQIGTNSDEVKSVKVNWMK
jgi:beta-glucosidase